jgi:nucleotide-binding universal stress UspA family protein
MSYRTILLHLDDSPQLDERMRVATDLAARMQAHLVGVATCGIARFLGSGLALDGDAVALSDHLHYLRHRATGLLARFTRFCQAAGLASAEARPPADDDDGGLCLQARYCDLLVLGQPDPASDVPSWPEDAPAPVVIHGGRPVLIVPYTGHFPTVGQHVLIAWDGGAEATRAVTAALPLLRSAQRVTVALFDPKIGPHAHGEEPGADLALFLARHGIAVDVRCETSAADPANALLSMVCDIDADLLVMGCYGHSRWREMLVGGTTRTVLASMTLPVLMAH